MAGKWVSIWKQVSMVISRYYTDSHMGD